MLYMCVSSSNNNIPRGRKHFLEFACSKQSVLKKCVQPNMTRFLKYTHRPQFIYFLYIFLKNIPELIPLKFCLSCLPQNSMQDRRISLISVSSNLGPAMAINIFHRCLVRSRNFPGTHRFLAGLFTFLSRRPVVNRFRASERNWFRTIITTTRKRKKAFLNAPHPTLLSFLL